jgi:replicative DNA helicase
MAEYKNKKNKETAVSRGMPKNVDAEQAVLCAFLIDQNAADSFIPKLSADDFYLVSHRIIFSAMKELLDESKPVDIVSVTDKLTMQNKLDEAGSVTYLSELSAVVPSAANAQNYVDIVKRDSMLRRIIQAGNEITEKGYGASEGEEALQFAEGIIYNIAQALSPSALTQIADACAAALKEIQDAQIGAVNERYINTGFPSFDEITRGLKPGELILLAARPAVGKTALALNIAAHTVINEKKNVAMFSLEMPTVQLIKRMLSHIAQVSSKKANTPRGLSTPEYTKIYDAFTKLINANFFIDDYSMNSPSDVLSKCRRLKREKGLHLVIIDYLQLMEPGGREKFESRQQEVSQMSRRLKIYAKELEVPILVLSQMSRQIEQRSGHEPVLADLRESGAIEQDADIVMFLHNPSKYQAGLPENMVQLILAKHRNGPPGKIQLEWSGDTNTFRECESIENAQPPKLKAKEAEAEKTAAQSGAQAVAVEAAADTDDDGNPDDGDLPF